MNLMLVTHANLNTQMWVDLDLLAAWYYSAPGAATHLVFNGGAMLPVSETVEQVAQRKENKPKETQSNGS